MFNNKKFIASLIVSIYISIIKSDSHPPKKVAFVSFNESLSKMMKNAFCCMSKALFVLKVLAFLSRLFWFCRKKLDKKATVKFNFYNVTNWTTNNYDTHIAQYRKK